MLLRGGDDSLIANCRFGAEPMARLSEANGLTAAFDAILKGCEGGRDGIGRRRRDGGVDAKKKS